MRRRFKEKKETEEKPKEEVQEEPPKEETYAERRKKRIAERERQRQKEKEKEEEELKKEIELVEKLRTDYMEEQGNIFADKEELERECTNDLRKYFQTYIKYFENFLKNFTITENDMNIIEKMNGENDTKSFAESNKSLMTGPKRNVYKEYSLDINFYAENFDIVKSKLKGKTPKEQREILKQLSIEITGLISNLIKEEPNEINVRIEQIAKDIKENRLNKRDYEYLINKFQERYDEFMKWKEEKVGNQDYRKGGY